MIPEVSFDSRTHASPHLRWSELACRDTVRSPYPIDWRETRGRVVGQMFEQVRAAVGCPLHINSAYRTPAYNASIGGAPSSQHVQGRALDIACPRGMHWVEFVLAARRAVALEESLIRGMGLYAAQGFIHVDCRPGDRLVVWTG